MKGDLQAIILLGGSGQRMLPLTGVVNKHLLPVYDKPLCFHSTNFLVKSGLRNIIAVVNRQDLDLYEKMYDEYVKTEYTKGDLSLEFVVQEFPYGTAHAIRLCRKMVKSDYVVTLWGDNIFEYTRDDFRKDDFNLGDNFSLIYLTKVKNPSKFGVVEIENDEIINIEDKPENPKSDMVCTGLMVFRKSVFRDIGKLEPNSRNEVDIMDLLRIYLKKKLLEYKYIEGKWMDVGVSPDDLLEASTMARTIRLNKLWKT